MRRAMLEPIETDDPDAIANAALCVLPGVGAFAAAMETLRARGIDAALVERVRANRPLLAICLGFQLLLDASEESPGIPGLGVARGVARRFGAGVRVPQIGWNRVTPLAGFASPAGWAYFANSYRLIDPPAGWTVAQSDYAGAFVAAMQRAGGAILACQFHPELSGLWGAQLISRWIVEAARS
jgi:glutamine amidotransferase